MNEIAAIISFYSLTTLFALIGFPLAARLFRSFPDKGWGFSRIIGIVIVAWLVWITSSLRLIPFNTTTASILTLVVLALTWVLFFRRKILTLNRDLMLTVLVEELVFISVFTGWTYVRGYSPDINGLEKFMDYGFMVSVMKTNYFPPLDHFLAGETINYYYFGHYLGALLTTLARIPAAMGYHLQMSLIFALTCIQGFSIGSALFTRLAQPVIAKIPWRGWFAGILTALFIGWFGNLHTAIYYPIERDTYWYPDATRFIEFTIHEFPIYSFIVNDLHGHVSDIPLVILALALLTVYALNFRKTDKFKLSDLFKSPSTKILIFLGFVIGMMYTINAWDFAIYLFLSGVLVWTLNALSTNRGSFIEKLFDPYVLARTALYSIILLVTAIIPYLPFWINLVPISQGLGIVPFGKQSPLWQIGVLWGVQIPIMVLFVVWVFKYPHKQRFSLTQTLIKILGRLGNLQIKINANNKSQTNNRNDLTRAISIGKYSITPEQIVLLVLSGVSLLLIILPEIIYIRDIYPTHFRANTMFKFYYQAWIMLGVVCGVSVPLLWQYFNANRSLRGVFYRIVSTLLIFAAFLYPINAMDQAFGHFKTPRKSIDGLAYLGDRFPDDAAAIEWINQNVKGQPTFAEAVGDSYTDYARIAANTGNPAVLGWPVHEWLWRGSYDKAIKPTTHVQEVSGTPDTVSSRVGDMRTFYESDNKSIVEAIVAKYKIEYIYIGDMERTKYTSIQERKFADIGYTLVYDKGNVQIYRTN